MERIGIIGLIFGTNTCGPLKVLEKISKDRYLVQFLDTGYITDTSYAAIKGGRVKDKYLPVVAGVGYIGDFKGVVSAPENMPFYHTWNDMINRCYNITDRDYPYYGGLGITVDIRWHSFANFFDDAHYIPNYDMKVKYPSKYQLDKDYLQMHLPKSKRVYSKNTCIWISKEDNTRLMNIDFGSNTGYVGVLYRDHAYHARFNNASYSKYSIPEAAAVAYNVIYENNYRMDPFCNIPAPNKVNMTMQEASEYMLEPKTMCVIVEKQDEDMV